MFFAVADGRIHVLREILEVHPTIDINWVNQGKEGGWTALHQACELGDTSIGVALLSHPGISVNQASQQGDTPLCIACRFDHHTLVQALLSHPAINVSQKDRHNWTSFTRVCFWNSPKCARLLLEDSRTEPNVTDYVQGTGPVYAVERGYLEVVKWCIVSGRGIDLRVRGDATIGVDMATLLEKFKENPEETRRAVMNEYRVTGKCGFLSIFWVLVVIIPWSTCRFHNIHPACALHGGLHGLPSVSSRPPIHSSLFGETWTGDRGDRVPEGQPGS